MTLLDAHALEHLHGLGQEEWVQKAQERMDILSDIYGLQGLQPLHGGRSGALARGRDQEGNKIVAKIMLPDDLPGQALALENFAGCHVPRLIACEPELCALIIEDLGGAPQGKEEEVDLLAASEIMKDWQQLRPLSGLPNQYERVEYWASMSLPRVRDLQDEEVERVLGWALEFSKRLPDGNHLLHADLGRHNLIWTKEDRLHAVDPTGAVGDPAYDAGALAVWGGSSVLNAPVRCLILAEYLDIPLERIESWAAVRCALSAGFAAMRGERQQRSDCLHVLLELLR